MGVDVLNGREEEVVVEFLEFLGSLEDLDGLVVVEVVEIVGGLELVGVVVVVEVVEAKFLTKGAIWYKSIECLDVDYM